MPKGKKTVKTTLESPTGRNKKFVDTVTKRYMDRSKFVELIRKGKYPEYHVRRINGLSTPVSNPDRKKGNNLD